MVLTAVENGAVDFCRVADGTMPNTAIRDSK